MWSHLRGEVDLDDLIVLSVLRDLDDRSIFDFLVENIDAAREDPGQGPLKGKDVSPAWTSLLGQTAQSEAIQLLVDVLGIKQLTSNRSLSIGADHQSVRDTGATDYFRRILQEQLLPGDVRDQEVLSDIEQWKRDRSGPMFSRLFGAGEERSRYIQVWETFAWRIEDDDLFELADGLIEETLKTDRAGASMQQSAALLATWRRLNRRGQHAKAVDWLRKAIFRSLPVSLRFADDLLYSPGRRPRSRLDRRTSGS